MSGDSNKSIQPGLTLYLVGPRTFAGKLEKMDDKLVLNDAVEFLTILNPQGVAVVSMLLGTLFIVEEEGLMAEMSKDSLYYRPYYQAVANLKLA